MTAWEPHGHGAKQGAVMSRASGTHVGEAGRCAPSALSLEYGKWGYGSAIVQAVLAAY